MSIPPVTRVPFFRPHAGQDGAADRRSRQRDEKRDGRKGAFTGRLPPAPDNPADRDDGSEPGRITDRTV